MNGYLLSVNTETLSLPKDWNKLYADRHNWPHLVRIASGDKGRTDR